MTMSDLIDVGAVVGVLLLGIAVFMIWGAAGVVGFAGVILIVLSVATAQMRARKAGKEQQP